MSRPATIAEAKAFIDFCENRFHCRIVQRKDAIELQVIGSALQAIGVPNLDNLLGGWSFAFGPLIYLSNDLDPDQMLRVTAHEVCHTSRFWKEKLDYAWLYIIHGESRVQAECEAYRANLEVGYLQYRQMQSVSDMVKPMLHGYALSDDDLKLAHGLCEVATTSVASGVISSVGGIAFRDWAAVEAPELLV